MIAARRPEDGSVYRELLIVNPNALVAKGISEAYIGHSSGARPVAVYDYETCVAVVMADKSMSYEQAVDYLSERIVPDFVGQDLPIFVVATN
jgi:hypothetical protein